MCNQTHADLSVDWGDRKNSMSLSYLPYVVGGVSGVQSVQRSVFSAAVDSSPGNQASETWLFTMYLYSAINSSYL